LENIGSKLYKFIQLIVGFCPTVQGKIWRVRCWSGPSAFVCWCLQKVKSGLDLPDCWWVLDKGFPAARTLTHPPNHPAQHHPHPTTMQCCVHGLNPSLFVNGLFINSCGLSHQTDIANGNEIRHEWTTEIHMPFSRRRRVKMAAENRSYRAAANSRPPLFNLEQIANLCWRPWLMH